LIEALALLSARGWNGTANLYGEGPGHAAYAARVAELGLQDRVRFHGHAPARTAFRAGRMLIVPSRAESLPYIVLEATGAKIPIVATRVGGVPEIFGPDADALVPPGDPASLAAAMELALAAPDRARAARLHDRVAHEFSLDAMTDAILAAYGDARRSRAAQRS
jgi:glycosyltransferase involved in cell wall biosynthesis